MPIVCPTITAYSQQEYQQQMEKIANLGHRIQIDLTDGEFTDKATITTDKVWWPAGIKADIHLMYKNPTSAVKEVIKHDPNLIIVHSEAEDDFRVIADLCRDHNINVGLALLPQTPTAKILPDIGLIQHCLIFSGNLGYQGGSFANLDLLEKAEELRKISPTVEIGWDGGINDQNVVELVNGGVDVLNVGGYIQNAEDPAKAFEALERIADETGET